MAGFDSVLKAIGYGVGAATGGPSQLKAVAGTVAVQGKIQSYLQSFGKSIGGIVGSDVFSSIATGAKVSADNATKSFVDTNILTSQAKLTFSWITGAVLLVIAYYFYRGKK